MDPITQGVLGASAAATHKPPKERMATLFKACVIGALAGMAPDLDILIRSSSDPLLKLEFHRHFSHSLFFIPVGALLCALLFHWAFAKRWQLPFKLTFIWSLFGFATHALLDGCTSYGTMLLWPLSNDRLAWDFVAVIDPAYTLPALLLIAIAAFKNQRRFAIAALIWMALYLALGFWQHQKALNALQAHARSQHHPVERIKAMPTLGNLLLWRGIYESEGHYYINAVRVGLFSSVQIFAGDTVPVLNPERDFPEINPNSIQGNDIARFSWFSDNFVALDPENNQRIIDVRYSMLPTTAKPLWSIEVDASLQNQQHVEYAMAHDRDEEVWRAFWGMLMGRADK